MTLLNQIDAEFCRLLPENHKVVTTKLQLFRRAHFVITFPISFYAHVHILCQLEKITAKQPSLIYQVAASVSIIYHIELEKVFLRKKHSCSFVFQKQSMTFPSSKCKISTS